MTEYNTNIPGGPAPAQSGQPSGSDLMAQRLAAMEAAIGQVSQAVAGIAQSRQQTEQETKIRGLLTSAETAVSVAEQKLRAAREAGNIDDEIAAQREHARAVAEYARLEADVKAYTARVAQQPPPQNDTGLRQFQAQNPWFGTDQEMTPVAIAFAKEIEASGVVRGSPAYFSEVTRRMRERFPDRMSQTPPPPAGGGAPAGGGGGVVRFTPDQLSTWRSMGIDVSNPDNIKALAAGRDEAVRRNILPPTPPASLGRIVVQR